jgi:hypothetical protein
MLNLTLHCNMMPNSERRHSCIARRVWSAHSAKFALTSITLLLVVSSCAHVRPPQYTYSAEELRRLIGEGEYWTPTVQDVERAREALQKQDGRAYNRYAMTFLGGVIGGRKLIEIIGDKQWVSRGFPSRPLMIVLHGDDVYFRVFYSVEQDRIVLLSPPPP